jgi:hypothetical protein
MGHCYLSAGERLTWGYVPYVCFEFLGPVENMQRKEGLRGFCCTKSEGVGVELSAEQER